MVDPLHALEASAGGRRPQAAGLTTATGRTLAAGGGDGELLGDSDGGELGVVERLVELGEDVV
jgi:hypothetical protein